MVKSSTNFVIFGCIFEVVFYIRDSKMRIKNILDGIYIAFQSKKTAFWVHDIKKEVN